MPLLPWLVGGAAVLLAGGGIKLAGSGVEDSGKTLVKLAVLGGVAYYILKQM